MAEPAEPALAEESEDGWQSRLFEYVGVGDPVLPFDPQDASKAAEMKGSLGVSPGQRMMSSFRWSRGVYFHLKMVPKGVLRHAEIPRDIKK